MKVLRKIIEIDEEKCDGCGQCVPSCAEGAIQIVDGKARVLEDRFCDGLGACLGECPNDALRIIEREADDFDEEAVEKYLSEKKNDKNEGPTLSCGCPSTKIQSFVLPESVFDANKPADRKPESSLSHWPVKIRLVPANAPFLKGADLLVLADCVSVAFPTLHRDFLKGRAVTMGCPKFDDVQEYIDKFAEIFNNAGIKSITVVTMEVPCCSGLPMIVQKGMEISKKKIPVEKIVISARGKILCSQ